MKKILVLCAVLVGLIAFTAMQPDKSPEFKFEKGETHNFGKIPQGTPVSVVFEFENIGEDPLIISEVKPTCGCTVADFTKTPVLKGKKGNVKLTFNAATVMPFTKMVTITSNARTSSKVLYIKGEVVSPSGK